MSERVMQTTLADEIDRLLARCVARQDAASGHTLACEPEKTSDPSGTKMPSETGCAPLDRFVAAACLSGFERDVLLLSAAVELESRAAEMVGQTRALGGPGRLTAAAAMALLGGGHWSAFSPERPLRRLELLRLERGGTFTSSPWRLGESVLHRMMGEDVLPTWMQGVVRPLWGGPLSASQCELGDRIALAWQSALQRGRPVLHIIGDEASDRVALLSYALGRLGVSGMVIDADDLPRDAAGLHRFCRVWDRESVLRGAGLVVKAAGPHNEETRSVLRRLQDSDIGLLIMLTDHSPEDVEYRGSLRFSVKRPTREEQRECWAEHLGQLTEQAISGSTEIDHAAGELSYRFDLAMVRQRELVNDAAAQLVDEASPTVTGVVQSLSSAATGRVRSDLEGLAEFVTTRRSERNPIVLPETQERSLMDLVQRCTHAWALQSWGFDEEGSRGAGVVAVFTGPSGTGKTSAAEWIAGRLGRELYRIDLSRVVSKYIGETEKNLGRVFTGAEQSGAVLLFDEADALFGKRSEVKDAHDRYANLEVGYLLQRLESYRGLALLTTNRRDSIDGAFLRRFSYVIEFPFPDTECREKIWRGTIPDSAPTTGLDFEALAEIRMSGGSIVSIARNAACLAAADMGSLSMKHIRRAAVDEHLKLGSDLAARELAELEGDR